MQLNNKEIRATFPYFSAPKNKQTIYFDNAATTHKPQSVIDAISNFYTESNSNIHRSNHMLGDAATEKYESCRHLVSDFVGAKNSSEIIFTSGTTESINLIAQSFGSNFVQANDIILVSNIEHHSNIIPWQMLAKKHNAILQEIPANSDLIIDEEKFEELLNNRVKLIAINHVSNVSGIMQNIKRLVQLAHKFNIPVLIDGAQAPAHIEVNLSELDCDFYCFSGHKIFGPTGTGVLFIKSKYLNKLPPYKTGGQMVKKIGTNKNIWSDPPLKFEAGTPNIAGIIGLHEAIQYINKVTLHKIIALEEILAKHMMAQLKSISNIRLYGCEKKVAPIFAFNIDGVHHHDLSTILSKKGVLIRAGHLCNQSLMSHLQIDGCLRVSLCFYNSIEEIDVFINLLHQSIKFLKR